MVGQFTLKGRLLTQLVRLMPALLIKPFSWARFVPASLDQDGATSSAVGFNIQLNDCDTDVASKAAVAFLGTTIDTNHTNVLALQSSAAGSATNVGVQILDKTGAALALDGASFSAQTTLNNGTNTIAFQARYYAIGAATPGAANADATFKVQYQ